MGESKRYPPGSKGHRVVLVLLIVVLALLGGFLGDLLQFAFWAVILLAVVGAALAFLAYRGIERARG